MNSPRYKVGDEIVPTYDLASGMRVRITQVAGDRYFYKHIGTNDHGGYAGSCRFETLDTNDYELAPQPQPHPLSRVKRVIDLG